MNLVEILQQQLSGEVGKKLGGLAGLKETEVKSALGAGVPAILSGLGSLASNRQGAGKIADAISGMDSGMFGDLANMVGGSMMQKGGGMLSSLFGSGLVDGIAGAISKATGINRTMIKTALGYLLPLVLGGIGGSMKGKVDADGISRLFSEQKQNIASSLPSGLNLNSIPAFQSLSKAVSAASSQAAPAMAASGGGLAKLLIPLAIVAALVVGGWYFLNRTGTAIKDTAKDAATGAADAAGGLKNNAMATAEDAIGKAGNAVGSLAGVSLDSIKSDLGGLMTGLTSDLGSITDAASAESALPKIKASVGKLDTLAKAVSSLPGDGKSMIGGLVSSQLEKINPLIEKISVIPGLGDSVKQILEQLQGLLTKLVGN